MRFEYLAEALYNYWKDRRDKCKIKCECPYLKTGTALRHHCIYPRPENRTYDKIECVRQACRQCKNLKRLQTCDKCATAFEGSLIKYQIYGKREFVRKRGKAAVDPDFTLHESRQTGTIESKPDFVLVETPYADFAEYLEEYWPTYIAHHGISKHQDMDWEQQRTLFPRGTFISTQDYSENYHHEAKKEYQSAYFVEIGSTVYGMVFRVHLDDIGTEAELRAKGMDPVVSDDQRVELKALFEKLGEPAILTISHIVMSTDLLHDAAMVQHCNDKFLIPWMEKIKAAGVTWVRHHARSDGCKAQFKCGTQFLWISSFYERHGIHLEWNLFCSCHGKDISDPECGTCKIAARNREMEHTELKPTRIRTAEELKVFCEEKLTWPQRTLKQKHGRGIFKRYFHYVPTAGALTTVEAIKEQPGLVTSGAVNRRIRKGTTIKGSSKFHVFADVGLTGHLLCRERGCHMAECPCWEGKYNQCIATPRDSAGLAQASHPLLPQQRQIATDSIAECMVPMTRNALCQRGIQLAGGLEGALQDGDIIAVYVEDSTEPMMLGKIVRTQYTITEANAEYTWMGQMKVGDEVIQVHKLEPMANGIASRYWKLKDGPASVFPIWVEDIRAVKIKLTEDKVRRGRSAASGTNPLDVRWEISTEERERFMITCG
jgi:hypothetical protein